MRSSNPFVVLGYSLCLLLAGVLDGRFSAAQSPVHASLNSPNPLRPVNRQASRRRGVGVGVQTHSTPFVWPVNRALSGLDIPEPSQTWAVSMIERTARPSCDENEWPYQPCLTASVAELASPRSIKPRPKSKNNSQPISHPIPVGQPTAGQAKATKPATTHTTCTTTTPSIEQWDDAIQIITLPNASSRSVVHYSLEQSGFYRISGPYGTSNVRSLKVLTAIPTRATHSNPPTTGTRYAMERLANTPMVSSPGGIYTGKQMIMLTNTSPGAEIYYTLDGELPTTASTLYTQPILLNSSTVLKAFAVARGLLSSEIIVASYTITDPALSMEIKVRGGDSVDVVARLWAEGAISVAGKWAVHEGNTQVCSADQTTQTAWHCPLKLTKGMHRLTATYAGANNGWRLAVNSVLKVK